VLALILPGLLRRREDRASNHGQHLVGAPPQEEEEEDRDDDGGGRAGCEDGLRAVQGRPGAPLRGLLSDGVRPAGRGRSRRRRCRPGGREGVSGRGQVEGQAGAAGGVHARAGGLRRDELRRRGGFLAALQLRIGRVRPGEVHLAAGPSRRREGSFPHLSPAIHVLLEC
jgi:hypothetical protein